MQPTITIDRQVIRDFEKTIAETIQQGKKSVSGAMIQAAVFASQSAAGAVYGRTASGRARRFGKKNRVSRKLRRLSPARDKKTGLFIEDRRKRSRPWWAIGKVEIWTKGKKETVYFRKESTFQKAKLIPRRGLAGNVWRAAGAVKAQSIQGVFMRALTATGEQRLIGSYSSNKVTSNNGLITNISMSNSLEYIQRAAPNSAREGVMTANKRLRGILDKGIARDIERAFQRRAANAN